MAFNFDYKVKIIIERLKLAKQFLQAAKYLFRSRLFNAFIYNLYMTVEPTAAAELRYAANEMVGRSKKHGLIFKVLAN